MKQRSILLGAALAGTLALVIFGDKGGDDEVVQAVPKKRGSSTASSTNGSTSASSAQAAASSSGPVLIGTLQKRQDLFGAHAGEDNLVEMRPGMQLRASKAPLLNSATSKTGKDAKTAALQVAQKADDRPDKLFGAHSWTPPPPPPPPPLPPPPPTAPPLPFTYIGKKLEDGRWEIYLAQGNEILIVHDKEQILNMYQIESIKPPNMVLTYLPLKQSQTLSIGAAE